MKLLQFLADKWGIGIVSSVGTAFIPSIDTMTPILQFLGITLGLIIGVLTVIEKFRKLLRKKKDEKTS